MGFEEELFSDFTMSPKDMKLEVLEIDNANNIMMNGLNTFWWIPFIVSVILQFAHKGLCYYFFVPIKNSHFS